MRGLFYIFAGLLAFSTSGFAQGTVRDGGGGGGAHYCIQRGVTEGKPWPVVALQNTCSEPVRVYFCFKNDLPDDEWSCNARGETGGGQFEANHRTTWNQMDELKLACVQPGGGSTPRPDPSCSRWTLVWNAEYTASNREPSRPDVPKPQQAHSGR